MSYKCLLPTRRRDGIQLHWTHVRIVYDGDDVSLSKGNSPTIISHEVATKDDQDHKREWVCSNAFSTPHDLGSPLVSRKVIFLLRNLSEGGPTRFTSHSCHAKQASGVRRHSKHSQRLSLLSFRCHVNRFQVF